MSGRIRTVKPEWLEDELIAMSSSDARVLSVALILMADDYGNGWCRPSQVAIRVFPTSDDSLESLANASRIFREALDRLVSIRFCGLYEVDGQHYFTIRKWKDHQRVDHPGKPLVPQPPEGFWSSSGESRECLANVSSLARAQTGTGTNEGKGKEETLSPEPPKQKISVIRNDRAEPLADPMGDTMSGNAAWQRQDVRRVFEQWKESVGLHGLTLDYRSRSRADEISDRLKTFGLDSCLLVARHCMQDGMVNGSADEKREHKTVGYIFGNVDAFERILTAAQKAHDPQVKRSNRNMIRDKLESEAMKEPA